MRHIYDDEKMLLKDLRSDIENVLMDEVLDKVREIEIEHIEEDVYSVYQPSIYRRRKKNGGLSDPENIIGTIEGDMQLVVENITSFNEEYGGKNGGEGLAEMVNDGGNSEHDYDYGFRGIEAPYSKPRPFLDNTIEEIENTNSVENTLANGLRKRKYDVI